MVIALLLLACGVVAVERAGRGSNDFDGFHAGARQVWEQGSLSEAKAVSRYPPLFQVLLAPLGALPVSVAAALWFLLCLAALLALPRALEQATGVTVARQGPAWLILAPFVVDDLMLGQSGLLLLWLATRAVALARRGGEGRAGALLGLCAGLKVLPALLLAVPLLLGRWRRTLLGLGLFALAGLALSVAVLGLDAVGEGLAGWGEENTTRQTPWALVQWGRSMRYNNQALATVLARSLGEIGTREARGAVHLLRLDLSVIWWLYGGLVLFIAARGLAAAAAARRLLRHAATRDDADPRTAEDLAWGGLYALSALTLLLAAPLVWTHYFLWTLPAFVVTPLRPRTRALVGAAFALGLAAVPLRALGLQLWISLGLFVVLSGELLRRGHPARYPGPDGASRSPAADAPPAAPGR